MNENRLLRYVGLALGLLVLGKALERAGKPAHGTMLGVPYDLRPPTLERLRNRWWNPASAQVFTPRTFGLGWDINLAAVLRRTGLLA